MGSGSGAVGWAVHRRNRPKVSDSAERNLVLEYSMLRFEES